MAITIPIIVEDIATQILTYTGIELYSASSVSGSYSLVTTITLVAGQYSYTYTDTAGTIDTWYKYRYHNSTGPVNSDYSNSFQSTGVTRKRIRQNALKNYKAGYILSASSSGQSTTAATFASYMTSATTNSSKRGVGTWLYPTTGLRTGEVVKVSAYSAATPGVFTVTPALTGVLATADEVEWHWFASPEDWNDAINSGLERYYFLDRIPIIGTATAEQSLSYLPWLYSRDQVAGLWHYPIPNDIERAWGRGGRWWDCRQESGYLTLMTKPALQATDTVYLEALRQAPQVYTDDSVLPSDINIDLAAAFAYDELLKQLLKPTHTGSASVDKENLTQARKDHISGSLRILKHRYGPHPRWQPQQLYEESNYARPFQARY